MTQIVSENSLPWFLADPDSDDRTLLGLLLRWLPLRTPARQPT